MKQLGKDIFSAQYRILDHKVFVKGEIEGFLNSFEVQRNDSEVEALFKVTETVGALKYELSDKCIKFGSQHLSEISIVVKDLLGQIEDLYQTLQVSKKNPKSESQVSRDKRKEEFEWQLKHKYERVENSFAIKEEEISELYSDLEHKLNIHK